MSKIMYNEYYYYISVEADSRCKELCVEVPDQPAGRISSQPCTAFTHWDPLHSVFVTSPFTVWLPVPPAEDFLLLLYCNMVVQEVAGIFDPKGSRNRHASKGNHRIEHQPERSSVRLFEGFARGRHHRRGDTRYAGKRHRDTDGVLDDGRNQGAQVGRAVPGAEGRSGEVAAQVPVDGRGQDRRENGIADGAAGAAERAEQARADAQLLDGDEEARGDVGQRGDPGEGALAKELHDAPCHLVGGDDGGVRAGEGDLHDEREDDLVLDVLDEMDKAGHDPAAQYAGHCGGNHRNTNLERVIREHVQRSLWPKGGNALPVSSLNVSMYILPRKSTFIIPQDLDDHENNNILKDCKG